MTQFNPAHHFEFKGKVYYKGGCPAYHIAPPDNITNVPLGSHKVIHVNRHHIAANRKDGGKRPCYTIKVAGRKKATYARRILINGPSECVSDDDQLTCGARVWIETRANITLIDEMDYETARQQFPDAVMED